MARKEDSPRATTTPRFPDTTPPQTFPSGDYSYTIEAVGTINLALGKLTEAVDSLKEQSKEHSKKIDAIAKDIHAAKVVGWVLAGVFGCIGWVLHEVIQYLASHPTKP